MGGISVQLHSEHAKLLDEAKEEVNRIIEKLFTAALVIRPEDNIDTSEETECATTETTCARPFVPLSEANVLQQFSSDDDQDALSTNPDSISPRPQSSTINDSCNNNNNNDNYSSTLAANCSIAPALTAPNLLPTSVASIIKLETLVVKQEIDGQLVRRIELGDRYDLFNLDNEPCHCDECLGQLYLSEGNTTAVVNDDDLAEQNHNYNDSQIEMPKQFNNESNDSTVNGTEPALNGSLVIDKNDTDSVESPVPSDGPVMPQQPLEQTFSQTSPVVISKKTELVTNKCDQTNDATTDPISKIQTERKNTQDDSLKTKTESVSLQKASGSLVNETSNVAETGGSILKKQIKRRSSDEPLKKETKSPPQKKLRLEQNGTSSGSKDKATKRTESSNVPKSDRSETKSRTVSTTSKSSSKTDSDSTRTNSKQQPEKGKRSSRDSKGGHEDRSARTSISASSRNKVQDEDSAKASKANKSKAIDNNKKYRRSPRRERSDTNTRRRSEGLASTRWNRSPSPPPPSVSSQTKSASNDPGHRFVEKFTVLYCRCEVCHTRFTSISALRRHEYQAHQLRAMRCVHIECRESFHEQRDLLDHVRRCHREVIQWSCRHCGKVCHTARFLNHHIFLEHQRGSFRCTFAGCEHTCSYRTDALRHYAEGKHQFSPPTAAAATVITSAGKSCSPPKIATTNRGESEEVEHTVIASDEKSIDTTSSDKKNATSPDRSLSVPITCAQPTTKVNDVDRYTIELVKCSVPDCKWFFASLDNMEAHLRATHSRQPIGCIHQGCLCSFDEVSNWSRHIKEVHPNVDRWLCSASGCDFGALEPEEMYLHQYRFHHEGRFRCTEPGCNLEYRFRDAVIQHFDSTHRVVEAKKNAWSTTRIDHEKSS